MCSRAHELGQICFCVCLPYASFDMGYGKCLGQMLVKRPKEIKNWVMSGRYVLAILTLGQFHQSKVNVASSFHQVCQYIKKYIL